jgi:cell fate regulator YaaT (PSP1 superfamily)
MTPDDSENQKLELRVEAELKAIEEHLKKLSRLQLDSLTEENTAFIKARRDYLDEGQKIKFASILKVKEETKPTTVDGKNVTH